MDAFQRVKLTIDGDVVGEAKEKPQYYGQAKDGSMDGGFRDSDSLASAMADPKYRTDPDYRSAVAALVAKTSRGVLRGHQPEAQTVNSGDVIEQQIEAANALFSDPRYAKSASFRAEVARVIAQRGNNDGATRLQALGDPSGAYRVQMSSDASVAPMTPFSQATAQGEADGSDD